MGATKTYVEFVSNAKKLLKDIGGVDKAMGRLGAGIEKHSRAFRNAGLGMAAGLGAAAKVAGDFDQQLANMNSVARASAGELAEIRQMALKLGGATIHGPRKLAEATYWLASAGQKAAQMMKTLPGLARLATATQHDLGATTTIVVGALNAFNYEADETERIANALAAAIGGSQGNMDKFGASLSSVGAVAGGFGRDIEEVLAPLAKLYDANIEASVAGTSLKTMYLALLAPNAQLIDFTERTGVALSDLDPRTRSLTDILATLVDKGFDAADAVEGFGRESATAASVLLGVGSPALREFQREITGTSRATEMAEGQQKGFNNQMKLFRSSLEELGIELGTNLLEPLTDITAKLRDLVSATSDWSPEAKTAAVNTGLWATGSLLLLSIYDKLAPKIATAARGVKWLGVALAGNWQWLLKNAAQGGAYIKIADEMGSAGTQAALDQAQALINQGAAFDDIVRSMQLALNLGADLEGLEWPQPPEDWGMEFGIPSSPLPADYWDAVVPPPEVKTKIAAVALTFDETLAKLDAGMGTFRDMASFTGNALDRSAAGVTTFASTIDDTLIPALDNGLTGFQEFTASMLENFTENIPAALDMFMGALDQSMAKMVESEGKWGKAMLNTTKNFLIDFLKMIVKAKIIELMMEKVTQGGKIVMSAFLNPGNLVYLAGMSAVFAGTSAALNSLASASFAKGGVVTESGQFTGMFDAGDMIVGPDRIKALLSGKGGGGTSIEAHIHVHGDLAMSKGELDDSLSGFADRLALQMG